MLKRALYRVRRLQNFRTGSLGLQHQNPWEWVFVMWRARGKRILLANNDRESAIPILRVGASAVTQYADHIGLQDRTDEKGREDCVHFFQPAAVYFQWRDLLYNALGVLPSNAALASSLVNDIAGWFRISVFWHRMMRLLVNLLQALNILFL